LRSPHWEYLAYVLLGVGTALLVSGIATLLYFQRHPEVNPQYGPYPIPLTIAGACTVVLSIFPFARSKKQRIKEIGENEACLPPPPPENPPPPP
jgi:hypothetical protein